jgi:hypothetical protein
VHRSRLRSLSVGQHLPLHKWSIVKASAQSSSPNSKQSQCTSKDQSLTRRWEPCFCASCAHPPARASPPFFSAQPFTLSSNSGRVSYQTLQWPRKGLTESLSHSQQTSPPQTGIECGTIPANSVTLNLLRQFLQHVNLPRSRLPLSNLFIICSVHLLPSLQGVHWPQLSCL